ncbi:MAG: hypothetical protein AB4352_20710 [Hormoscilla sp.]
MKKNIAIGPKPGFCDNFRIPTEIVKETRFQGLPRERPRLRSDEKKVHVLQSMITTNAIEILIIAP